MVEIQNRRVVFAAPGASNPEAPDKRGGLGLIRPGMSFVTFPVPLVVGAVIAASALLADGLAPGFPPPMESVIGFFYVAPEAGGHGSSSISGWKRSRGQESNLHAH